MISQSRASVTSQAAADAAREGERLLYGDIGGGYFWIHADIHLHFGGGTEEVPLADGETIDLGDVSALWD